MRIWRESGGVAGVIACLLAVGTVVIVGCGESSAGESAVALRKDQFVRQGDAICQRAKDDLNQVSKELASSDGESDPSEEAAAGVKKLVGPVKTMGEELAELGAPRGDNREVGAIIAAFEAGVETLEAAPAGPKSSFAFVKANRLAASYGLYDCTV